MRKLAVLVWVLLISFAAAETSFEGGWLCEGAYQLTAADGLIALYDSQGRVVLETSCTQKRLPLIGTEIQLENNALAYENAAPYGSVTRMLLRGDRLYLAEKTDCSAFVRWYSFDKVKAILPLMPAMIEPPVCYKPVIYLYPEAETAVTVQLSPDGGIRCAYPAYDGAWRVTAASDGTLTDDNGQTYNYLYWEGAASVEYDFSEGFCVKGEDTAAFLESALARLGLNRREANEFIVYWLPLMQPNPYNIISFQTDAYVNAAKLEISPKPETLLRVFMAWYPCESEIEIAPQRLTGTERTGFTVVEWGGTPIK